MADITLSPSRILSPRLGNFFKRVAALLVSYEVAAYGLASVQAMGLTLPTMVNSELQVDTHAVCARHLHDLAVAAEDWSKNHPEQAWHRPTLEELGRDIDGGLPTCPDGGMYEIVPAGRTLKSVDGLTAVVPQGRLAFRCAHNHDMGTIENPYEALRRRQTAWQQ